MPFRKQKDANTGTKARASSSEPARAESRENHSPNIWIINVYGAELLTAA